MAVDHQALSGQVLLRHSCQLHEDAYLTDGTRLFRCLPAEAGPMLMLEDCQSLELFLASVEELLDAELRLVTPGIAIERNSELLVTV